LSGEFKVTAGEPQLRRPASAMRDHSTLVLPAVPPRLQGERLLLRPLQGTDLQQRLALGRDPEFHRLAGGDPARASLPLTLAYVERWYTRHVRERLFWVIEEQGRMIGTAWLHGIDARHRRARYAIGIFAPEHRGLGHGREATHLVLGYAFATLGLHRVELRVLAFNTGAIAMYERCGFVREGVERESVHLGGTWQSEVLMAVLEDEYRASRP
jgi:[ribosomal protein S5]-alanine N-acetyltransferase